MFNVCQSAKGGVTDEKDPRPAETISDKRPAPVTGVVTRDVADSASAIHRTRLGGSVLGTGPGETFVDLGMVLCQRNICSNTKSFDGAPSRHTSYKEKIGR